MKWWIIWLVLLGGCHEDKVVNSTPTPGNIQIQPTVSAYSGFKVAELPSVETLIPTPTPENSPSKVEAWEGYAQAYRDLKAAPTPQILEGAIPDPSVISANINFIAQKLQILQQQREIIEGSLSTPEDRERWKQFQRNLEAQ